MKKIIYIFILLIIAAGFIYPEKNIKLTKDYLVNNKWKREQIFINQSIYFNNDNTFKIHWYKHLSEHYYILSGKYKIKEEVITLYDLLLKAEPEPKGSGKTYKLNDEIILEFDKTKENNFEYHYKLTIKNAIYTKHDGYISKLDFYNINSPVKNGDILSVDGDHIRVLFKQAVATENLNLRTKPSIDSKTKQINFDIKFKNIHLSESQSYIPKDYEINILGRTENKVKVNNWYNYWYYVSFIIAEDMHGPAYEYGWIFGEFVKFTE